ncbi:MAG TPA: hypothetical protein VKU00_29450 [Chthonomonadaceae bacterium]|nr:hypothetical protein [Chthonomonadaceae bacterium]
MKDSAIYRDTNSWQVNLTPVHLSTPLIAALDRQARREGLYSRSSVIWCTCWTDLQRHADVTTPGKGECR